MAGLLSGYVGDDETKDQFGMTEADRRAPLFAGLIKAGLLGVAAGGPNMPADRSNLIAQMGGALGGIPQEMAQAAAQGAQQKLRGQQLDENKRKGADRERVRAFGQSPEGQALLASATGANKLALQMAIESGDIAQFNTAVGNLDRTEIAAARAEVAKAKADAAALKTGMAGTGYDQQMTNWLMQEPSDSQKYREAYEYFSQERRERGPDGERIIPKRDMSGRPVPSFKYPGEKQNTAPPPGEVRKDDDGTIVETSKDGTVTTYLPNGDVTRKPLHAPEVLEKKRQPSQKEIENLRMAVIEGESLEKLGSRFLEEWKKAGVGTRVKSLFSPTPLNTAWTNLGLMAKGEQLYNLGVLNGQDLEVIRRAIPDPSTLAAGTVSEADLENSINQVLGIMRHKIEIRQRLLGVDASGERVKPTPTQGGGGGGGGFVEDPPGSGNYKRK